MIVNEGTFGRLKETAASAIAERNELREENAKLRKLAHDLLQPILADGFDCYGCVENCNGRIYTDRCKLLDRARELGAEVD